MSDSALALSDLLISTRDANFSEIADSWKWVLRGSYAPIASTRFGDLFCACPSGEMWRLDVLVGDFQQVTESEQALLKQAAVPEWRSEYLREPLLQQWRGKGLTPSGSQCLAFAPHPLLTGGKFVQRPMLMELKILSHIYSQILLQASR